MLKECKELVVKINGQEAESIYGMVQQYYSLNTRTNARGITTGYEISAVCLDANYVVGFIDLVNPENSWSQYNNLEITLAEQEIKQETKQGIILNYTPHTVNIIDSEGNKIQDFPSIGEARCRQSTTQIGAIGNIPVSSTSFGEVEGLPEEKENTYYIVSRLIKQALPERTDLLVPNEIVRDTEGIIIGCKSLANN